MDRVSSNDQRHGFEVFYAAVRDDLLLQTYALTGDLVASQRAVRDALVVAWHHWRKVSRLDDPAGWVRPQAWAKAQRRHTARWWHRQRDVPDDSRATLDALGQLTTTQRKALLLTALTAQPLAAIAAEVGLSRTGLERELQLATSQFALAREVSSTSVRPLLEALRGEIDGVRWPRATILLRAGTTRRRTHAAVGIAAVAAATVVSGTLVTDATGVTPRLSSKPLVSAPAPAPETATASPAPEEPLANAVLLTAEQVAAGTAGTWTVGETSRNTEGDGLNITCQGSRYADPQGVGALVRTFSSPVARRDRAPGQRGPQTRTAVQAVERSTDPEVATATFDLTRSWYGACALPRTQLIASYDVAGVADAASMVVLRSWSAPVTTTVVGVARTGSLTTTVASSTPGARAPDVDAAGALLGTAVSGICTAPGGATCPTAPAVTEARPLPLPEAPAMIGELDLPAVDGVEAPWAATAPAAATTNDASTRCDDTDFSGARFSHAATRSYLVPEATDLPPQFGLTETVGALRGQQAQALVAQVRERLDTCAERDLGTQVTRTDDVSSRKRSLTAWTLRVEIADDRFVDYRMAILRSGTAVAQLGFIGADGADLTAEQFRALCSRALERLDQLPAPA